MLAQRRRRIFEIDIVPYDFFLIYIALQDFSAYLHRASGRRFFWKFILCSRLNILIAIAPQANFLEIQIAPQVKSLNIDNEPQAILFDIEPQAKILKIDIAPYEIFFEICIAPKTKFKKIDISPQGISLKLTTCRRPTII